MHPALFYRPGGRLSLPELTAARLDGDVIEVGDGYMPADSVEDADARATSVRELVPAHAAACGPTAAWIHGAGDAPPGIHHVRRIVSTRTRVPHSPRVMYHEARASRDDVQSIGGTRVLTPLATAVELLFATALTDADDWWLRALLQARSTLLAELSDVVDASPRRPGRRGAAEHLQKLGAAARRSGQEVVTRYTS
ncbi:hypothetical protein Q9R19_06220 [Microbacterium sp. ARD32]|uniref:hypothetical protein n=1 Tax=Microbacterium sp. ARD32 TaxID=2962577 RepID=UPI002882070C|nr:hypothetical protein [Microbacterium sp. ARD32]MDT0157218.1 hypothetical protein [Microbacterium sp. ARD32]